MGMAAERQQQQQQGSTASAAAAQAEAFERDGYVLVRQLLDAEEVELLRQITANDAAIHADGTRVERFAYDRGKLPPRTVTQGDGDGGKTAFFVDDDLGDDYLSAVARCERVVGTMERLLGSGELYHWHHKMMLKHGVSGGPDDDASSGPGGGFRWHQDFGYWSDTGSVLFPRMGSCMVAVTRTTQQNGCLQVIRGSHAIGLVNHARTPEGQAEADPARVDAALAALPLDYIEMEPGDGLFFHCNLLHKSDQNTSTDPRWSLISCFNARSNEPFDSAVHHPSYTPLPVRASLLPAIATLVQRCTLVKVTR
jgi:ectoine hydroxylase-related dioxygenase (phytanoyl-CoA dioxygenase family)